MEHCVLVFSITDTATHTCDAHLLQFNSPTFFFGLKLAVPSALVPNPLAFLMKMVFVPPAPCGIDHSMHIWIYPPPYKFKNHYTNRFCIVSHMVSSEYR